MKKHLLIGLSIVLTFNVSGQIEYLGTNQSEIYDFNLIKLDDGELKVLNYSDYTFELLNLDNSISQTTDFDTNGLNIGDGNVSMYIDSRYTTNKLFDTDEGVEIVVQYLLRSSTDKSIFYVIDDNGDNLIKVIDGYNPTTVEYIKSADNYSILLVDSLETFVKKYKLPGILPSASIAMNLDLQLSNDTLSLTNSSSKVYLGLYKNSDNQQLSYSNDTVYLTNGGWIYIGNNTSAIEGSINTNNISTDIYPNPTANRAILSYNLNNNDEGALIIYDSKGGQVDYISLNTNAGIKEIDLSNLQRGVYLYKVIAGHKESIVSKLIVH